MKTFIKRPAMMLVIVLLAISFASCNGASEEEDTNELLDGILNSPGTEDTGGADGDADSDADSAVDEDEEPTSEGPDGPPNS